MNFQNPFNKHLPIVVYIITRENDYWVYFLRELCLFYESRKSTIRTAQYILMDNRERWYVQIVHYSKIHYSSVELIAFLYEGTNVHECQ